MCGIVGLFNLAGAATKEQIRVVDEMNTLQFHRGPDGAGIYHDGPAVLGNRRLSLIDLSHSGDQPISNEDETVWITYNGEIYNFQVLRNELERDGHRFRSHTDTEVLVHGYEQWGIGGLLQRLRGMFAFAIYDKRSIDRGPILVLARDRLGIKPLYYGVQPGRLLAFASEVASLKKSGLLSTDEDPNALLAFLLFGSIPSPLTTLASVRALRAGHYMMVGASGVEVREYYSIEHLFTEKSSTPSETNPTRFYAEMRDALEEAVSLHLISDAPIGVFLSGGIDSTALVALAKHKQTRLTTIGVVFGEKGFSEEPYQQIVIDKFQVEHHRIAITLKDFHDELEHFMSAMDQPTVDGLNTYFVARAARKSGLKAVLSGLGGDEVFGGYNTLQRAKALRRMQSIPSVIARPLLGLAGALPSYRKLAFLRKSGAIPFYLVQRGLFTPLEAAKLLDANEDQAWRLLQDFEPTGEMPDTPATLQQFMEARHYLAHQLLKDTDVFGMAHSLEVRVPFLDHVLVEKVLQAPTAWRFDKSWPKPLLTRPLSDLIPNEIITRAKRGFTFPMAPWLRFSNSIFRNPGQRFNRKEYQVVWDSFMSGRAHWSRAWGLAVLARSN